MALNKKSMKELNADIHAKDEKNRLSPPHNEEEAKHMPFGKMDSASVRKNPGYKILSSESPVQRIIREKKEADDQGLEYNVTEEDLDRAHNKIDPPIEEAHSIGEQSAIFARREYAGISDDMITHSPPGLSRTMDPRGEKFLHSDEHSKPDRMLPPTPSEEQGPKSPAKKVKDLGRKVKNFFVGGDPSDANQATYGPPKME